MRRQSWLVLLLSMFLVECSDLPKSGEVFVHADNVIDSDSIVHLVPPMRKGSLSFDSIVDVVKFLPLSTSDTVLISNISDIKIMNEILYIADYKQGRIFAFNYDGEYIGRIDDRGDGPKQYKRICSFDVDHKRKMLYILDGDLGKVHIYDSYLRLQNIIKLPYRFADHIALYGEDKLFVELGFREYNKRSKTSPNLVLYNMKNKTVESSFFFFESGKIRYRSQEPIAFSNSDSGLFYWTTLGNNIYSCSDNILRRNLVFDLDIYATPSNIYFEKISKASSLMREKKYAYIDRFYEFKDWYYARIARVTSSAHYFYNKKKQKGFLDISFLRIKAGENVIMPDLFQISDTVFCGYLSPEQYMTLLSDQALENVHLEDNPILVFYTLKI